MRSTFGAAAGAAVLALLLTACGGGSTGGNVEGSGSGKVVVAVPSDDPGAIESRKAQAAAFMKANPDIQVQVLTVPSEGYDQKVLTMIAGGTPPDIFGSGDVQIPTIVSKHYALDLKPLIDKEGYDLADFYPQVVEGLTFNGQLVGLTDNWDTQVLYYNKSLFDAKQVPYPTEAWTWDDYVVAARKLTSGSGAAKTYGTVYDPWFVPIFDQIWSNGGEIFNADGTKCELSGPKAVEAMQWVADLLASGVAPTRNQLEQGKEAGELFETGRAAMLVGAGRWAAFDFNEVKKFDWAVAPLPKGSAGRANFFHLPMYAISANAKNKAGAWKFLKYMVSPEAVRVAAEHAQGIPSRRSVANDPKVAQNELAVEHDAYQPFLASLQTVRRAPYIANFPEIEDELEATLDTVILGKKRAADAAGPLCAKLDQILAETGP